MNDIINEETLRISNDLKYKLDQWFIESVLNKSGIEINCMSGDKITKLTEGIEIKISKDKRGKEIYSATKDGKIISQILI